MRIGIIGAGAIGSYVARELQTRGITPHVLLVRSRRAGAADDDVPIVNSAADLPDDLDLMVDCAGHAGLAQHGPAILLRGIDMITVSLGALAEARLYDTLQQAAKDGKAQLHLASGAIGALDALSAAKVGGLTSVTYTGRKPPNGWKGSPAEAHLDLKALSGAETHFEGTARQAATEYPKNANVAAAVALAGLGFDDTRVALIADPDVTSNIHEINATGAFGQFTFRIEGNALPENPRSSALAAMSVISAIERRRAPITI